MKTIEKYKDRIDTYIKKQLISGSGILCKAIQYSTTDGGKRLRPLLCIGGSEACGGKGNVILPVASAMELVHTFSLIHDDLPCIDNDDFRRGKPTSHKVFGEDIAILAGDALLAMAFEWIADAPKIANQKKVSIIKELCNCVGKDGLIGGQVLDIRVSNPRLSMIKSIYLKKTAALITASVRIGAIANGAKRKELTALTEFGKNIGLSFQIIDDLKDLEQDSDKKISYPLLVGKEKAKKEAEKLITKAVKVLAPFGKRADLLRDIASLIHGKI